MRLTLLAFALIPLSILLNGCAGAPRLDPLAESYVKLVLAVGHHDALYVDAFYGPPAWKAAAARGEPVPLPDILATTRALRRDLEAAEGPTDRKRYLDKQLVAVGVPGPPRLQRPPRGQAGERARLGGVHGLPALLAAVFAG